MTHQPGKKKVLVLGTGGTIAGVAADPGDNVGLAVTFAPLEHSSLRKAFMADHAVGWEEP